MPTITENPVYEWVTQWIAKNHRSGEQLRAYVKFCVAFFSAWDPQFDEHWFREGLTMLVSDTEFENERQLGTTVILQLGQVVLTPGFRRALAADGGGVEDYLHRHEVGDWGVVRKADRDQNEEACRNGQRVTSSYLLASGVRFWVMTGADRLTTTCLLPSEF